VLKFRDGKTTEEIAYFDTASLQAQLGAPGKPRAR
jgi:hypothetical protein